MAVSIFFCYARKDRAFLEEIKIHLSPLLRQNIVDIWYDADISPGSEWEEEIKIVLIAMRYYFMGVYIYRIQNSSFLNTVVLSVVRPLYHRMADIWQ